MRYFISGLIVLCLAVISFAAGPEAVAPGHKGKCPVCGMYVAPFADWNARIEFTDGEPAIFDGAKDMLKYYLDIQKYHPSRSRTDVAAIFVKDYASAVDIDARRAFYVIWSDVYGPMGHEPIPFATKDDAEKFLKEHKGKAILRFEDITGKLIAELDDPPE